VGRSRGPVGHVGRIAFLILLYLFVESTPVKHHAPRTPQGISRPRHNLPVISGTPSTARKQGSDLHPLSRPTDFVLPTPALPAARNLLNHAPFFVENRGQYVPEVKYRLSDRNVSVFFTSRGFRLAAVRPANGVAVAVDFVNGHVADPRGVDELASKQNYYQGPSAQWHTSLPTFRQLVYSDVWPGIDVVYESQPGVLKYSLVVAPGADPRAIGLAYRGSDELALGRNGSLVVQTALGQIIESRPVTYQGKGVDRREVDFVSPSARRRSFLSPWVLTTLPENW